MSNGLGLTHIYCGDGKGKTSASLGIILRSIGCDYNVVYCQFLKDGDSKEINVLKKFHNVKIITNKGVPGFTWNMTKEEMVLVTKNHNKFLEEVIHLCNSNKCDVVVLDEIIGTVNSNLIDYNLLMDFLKCRPKNIEVIMTGRNPNEELISLADYVSEVRKIKHPFDKGIEARFGVDK